MLLYGPNQLNMSPHFFSEAHSNATSAFAVFKVFLLPPDQKNADLKDLSAANSTLNIVKRIIKMSNMNKAFYYKTFLK